MLVLVADSPSVPQISDELLDIARAYALTRPLNLQTFIYIMIYQPSTARWLIAHGRSYSVVLIQISDI